ncbi:NB-ARC domain-containing protein [Asanoa sp. WMMD1127]|uniref:XRE family transcriptional regulator n=1 Tax=Asanoa sp. WMMD1127 TaxID=3016107 RepID=UPI0024180DCA|nr:XRE family transcriptional regulator [Asanoa sp. WMMD1127]MDG4823753.1 NB-ARC domain-containing protein [Asanoa sp. WMMD1127]
MRGRRTDPPNPLSASTVDEFGACLRQLKKWAGDPSFGELGRRTGVPRSTLADALSARRARLPRLEVIQVVVRACGGDAGDLARWESGWRRVQERVDAAAVAGREPLGTTLPRQLPRGPTALIGRDQLVDRLGVLQRQHAARANRSMLVMLVGAAGVGKTALAVDFGHRVARNYPDGQLYADFCCATPAQMVTVDEVLPMFLETLGVPRATQPAGVAAQGSLFRSLTYSRRLLVLLDNVRDADHVRPLLTSGPSCATVVTSRDRLSGLVAREDGTRITVRPLDPPDAVDLIALMLQDRRGVQEPEAIFELARLCGYLPMALRTAAANLADRPDWPISAYVATLAASSHPDPAVPLGGAHRQGQAA